MIGVKPFDTSMIPNVKLRLKDGELLEDPQKYRHLIGKLNHLTITKHDIAFSISVVSQFMNFLRTIHWDIVMYILSYLKKSSRHGILYENYSQCKVEEFPNRARCLMDW